LFCIVHCLSSSFGWDVPLLFVQAGRNTANMNVETISSPDDRFNLIAPSLFHDARH
jgi:hypothetical protein